MQPLPIDALLPQAIETLRRTHALVIEAPPGAGKTTRVPSAVLDAGLAGGRDVIVLEPRRLAARMAARRVAEELGESVGETVGYQVRFEDVSGARTRMRFVTEGVLTRRLLADPLLESVGVVVLDEFHERHLQADLALALLRRLQLTARPDLKLVAMSATLDAAPVAAYLGDCPVLRSEGRHFDVKVEHLARHDERPLEFQVEGAVRRLVAEGLDGDVLVFLPGAASIRRALGACAAVASEADLLVLPLHGELTSAQQDAAVRPAAKRKIILSTNVAETSVTIEGVAAVVDSGLARIAGHSPWSGLPVLKIARVSRASAVQRAGRAGRTREGRCLRLYTAQDFGARPAHETPEVQRLDLAESSLELRAAGVRDLRGFDWFESPSHDALEAADALLFRLGATNNAGRLTDVGRRMLSFPLHPRLARILVEAEARGVARTACTIVALVSERDIRAGRVGLDFKSGETTRERRAASAHGSSDLLELLDLFKEAEAHGFAAERLRRLDLEPNAVQSVRRVARQLVRQLERGKSKRETSGAFGDAEERELLISILAGYPDRVARRRTNVEARGVDVALLLSGGGAAELARESVVRRAEFLVAVDAEERDEASRARAPSSRASKSLVRLASAIEPDWLLDLFADALVEKTEARWNAQGERVDVWLRLVYDQIVIDERRAEKSTGEETTRVLAEAALAAGPQAFGAGEEVERLLARVEFVAGAFPEGGFPALVAGDVIPRSQRCARGVGVSRSCATRLARANCSNACADA